MTSKLQRRFLSQVSLLLSRTFSGTFEPRRQHQGVSMVPIHRKSQPRTDLLQLDNKERTRVADVRGGEK